MRGRAITPEQKDAVLAAIREAWDLDPHARLGQLLAGWLHTAFAMSAASSVTANRRMIDALFFTEDGDLAHNIIMHTKARAQRAAASRDAVSEAGGT